jgi:hypothetical protein
MIFYTSTPITEEWSWILKDNVLDNLDPDQGGDFSILKSAHYRLYIYPKVKIH